MVIHGALLAAVQVQPVAVVTVVCAVPPSALAPCEVGLTVNVQGGLTWPLPGCVTVNAVPATEMVAVRSAPVFGATE